MTSVDIKNIPGNPSLTFEGQEFRSPLQHIGYHKSRIDVNPQAARPLENLAPISLSVFALSSVGVSPEYSAEITGLPPEEITDHLQNTHNAFGVAAELKWPNTHAQQLAWQTGLYKLGRTALSPSAFSPFAQNLLKAIASGTSAAEIAQIVSTPEHEWTDIKVRKNAGNLRQKLESNDMASLITTWNLIERVNALQDAEAPITLMKGGSVIPSATQFHFSEGNRRLESITFHGATIEIHADRPIAQANGADATLTSREVMALGMRIVGMSPNDMLSYTRNAVGHREANALNAKLLTAEYKQTATERAIRLDMLTIHKDESVTLHPNIRGVRLRITQMIAANMTHKQMSEELKLTPSALTKNRGRITSSLDLKNYEAITLYAHIFGLAPNFTSELTAE